MLLLDSGAQYEDGTTDVVAARDGDCDGNNDGANEGDIDGSSVFTFKSFAAAPESGALC